MNNWWVYLSPIYTSIISIVVGYLVALIKKGKTTDKSIKIALGALLRSDMYTIYEEYRDADEIPESAQKEMDELWQAYHGLGYNHMGDKLHDEIMQKKTKVI